MRNLGLDIVVNTITILVADYKLGGFLTSNYIYIYIYVEYLFRFLACLLKLEFIYFLTYILLFYCRGMNIVSEFLSVCVEVCYKFIQFS